MIVFGIFVNRTVAVSTPCTYSNAAAPDLALRRRAGSLGPAGCCDFLHRLYPQLIKPPTASRRRRRHTNRGCRSPAPSPYSPGIYVRASAAIVPTDRRTSSSSAFLPLPLHTGIYDWYRTEILINKFNDFCTGWEICMCRVVFTTGR